MKGRDGRDDANDFESTDWLLAQLGQGRRPDLEGRDAPSPAEPQAEPPSEPPAEPIAPPPAATEPGPESIDPRARRSEETLDWFSLAEPAPTSSDAATRALPVVGEPIEADAAPTTPPAPPAAPTWTPPAGVRPPALTPESGPAPSEPTPRLVSVEPPVGAGATDPPSAPPAFPGAPPAAMPPSPPSPPPGPVTPPASFALTWGEPQIDSEAGLRAAFRQLSEPSAPRQPADAAEGSAPSPTAAAQPPVAQPTADALDDRFTPPPAAPGLPAPSQAPASAPPSWDDLAAAAAARSTRAAQPAQPAAEPPGQSTPSRRTDEYADELWSALHESESQPPAPEQAPPPSTPSAAPPAFEAFGAFAAFDTTPGAAPPEPASPQVEPPYEPQGEQPEAEPRGRFAAFAEDAFEAPVAPPPVFPSPSAPEPPAARAPLEPAPFDADLPPHQSFTPAPFGNPTAFAGQAPVDDLLAALGGGLAGSQGDRGTFGQSAPDADVAPARGPLPPMTGPIPSGFSELGLALGSATHGRRDDEQDTGAASRGGLLGSGRSRDDEQGDDESSIARQIAETGYFWNLTPDPGGVDPKAAADASDSDSDSDSVDDEGPGPRRTPTPAPAPEPEPEPFDPFAAVQPAGDPAAPDTDPFGLRQVFGDERDRSAALPSAAALAAARERDDALPTTAMPAARPNGGTTGDPLASLFGAGPDVVDATFPEAQADPWATAGYNAAGPSGNTYAAPAGAAAAGGATAAARAGGGTGGPTGGGRGPSGPVPSTASGSSGSGGRRSPAKVLAWIAGGLVAALVLVGLFFLGTQLTGGAQDAASESASPAETTPEAAPEPTAPQPAGVHAWDTLFGGECIDPFTDPWAEEFTVVDCAAPHAAQLVYRGTFPGDAAAPFPGEAALAEQMPALCSAAGVIDLAAAGGLTDLQVQGTYPVTEEQWAAGERTYYCFANRSSGEPLTAGIQGPGPAV